jgi:hypothetical protein
MMSDAGGREMESYFTRWQIKTGDREEALILAID